MSTCIRGRAEARKYLGPSAEERKGSQVSISGASAERAEYGISRCLRGRRGDQRHTRLPPTPLRGCPGLNNLPRVCPSADSRRKALALSLLHRKSGRAVGSQFRTHQGIAWNTALLGPSAERVGRGAHVDSHRCLRTPLGGCPSLNRLRVSALSATEKSLQRSRSTRED